MTKTEKAKKPFYKKVWFWAVALIIVVVAANSGGSDTEQATNDTSAPAATQTTDKTTDNSKEEAAAEATEKETALKVGDTGTLKDYFDVTLKSAEEKTKITYSTLEKTTDEKYVVVELQLKNISDTQKTIDSDMFKLVDADGLTYDIDIELNYMLNGDSNFVYDQVNPSLSRKGKIGFEVPKDAKDLKLMVDAGYNDMFGKSGELTFELE